MAKTPAATKEKSSPKAADKAPKGPSVNEQRAAEKAATRAKLEAQFGVAAGTCLSGSGVTPRKGLFAPGGDAKLKSRLLADFRTGNAAAKAKAEKQAEALGWSQFLTPAKPKAATKKAAPAAA